MHRLRVHLRHWPDQDRQDQLIHLLIQNQQKEQAISLLQKQFKTATPNEKKINLYLFALPDSLTEDERLSHLLYISQYNASRLTPNFYFQLLSSYRKTHRFSRLLPSLETALNKYPSYTEFAHIGWDLMETNRQIGRAHV